MRTNERRKMKIYLEQLATIERALRILYLMSVDIIGFDLRAGERKALWDCEDAVITLLAVISKYCK